MSPETQLPLLTSLLVLLVAARLLGALAQKLDQPALLGEMLAGILLGPAAFDWIHITPALSGVAELSMFFIILGAGLELDPAHVLHGFKGRALWTVALGFGLPFGAGIATGLAWDMPPMHALFLGVCVSITALPVAVRMLGKFGLLKTRTTSLTLSSAVVSDVLALLMLGVMLNQPAQPTLATAGLALGQSLIKLAGLMTALGLVFWALKRHERWGLSLERGLDRVSAKLGPELIFGLAALFVLLFGSLSENLGFHAVVGCFFGATILSQDLLGKSHYQEVTGTLKGVSEGFLAPVFFATLGLHFTLGAFDQPGLMLVLLGGAVASKLLAGRLGGALAGMGAREAWGMGAILNGRGVMELVVAGIALKAGFIDASLFSLLVLMGTFTTLLSPVLYRAFVPSKKKH